MESQSAVKQKRVLVLLYNKFTSDTRVLKECTSLVKAGYKVELWAVYDPNLPEVETVNGFLIRRKFRKPKIRKLPFLNKRNLKIFARFIRRVVLKLPMLALKPFPAIYMPAKKVLNGIEKWFSKIFKDLRHIYVNMKKPTSESGYENLPFDIIHCNDLLPLPLATNIKKQNPNMKLVYDTHEYQIELAGLKNQPIKKTYFEMLERKNIYDANTVITVSPSIATEYERVYGLKKVNVVLNCPDLSTEKFAGNHFEKVFGFSKDQIIFLYQGGFSSGKGIEDTLSAFVKLDEMGIKTHQVVFMGMGGLEEEIKRLATIHKNIHFHLPVKPDQIPEISSSADYGIFFAPNASKNHWFCLPNKIFEYITCGLPVIASPLFEVNKLVSQEKVGYVAKDFEGSSLFELIKNIHEKPSYETRENIKKLHINRFNWNIEEKKLLDIYSNLTQ